MLQWFSVFLPNSSVFLPTIPHCVSHAVPTLDHCGHMPMQRGHCSSTTDLWLVCSGVYLKTAYIRCRANTIQLNQAHMVLNATSVGISFLLLAHISVRLVISVSQYSCHMLTPNIKPGMMITALASQLTASTRL